MVGGEERKSRGAYGTSAFQKQTEWHAERGVRSKNGKLHIPPARYFHGHGDGEMVARLGHWAKTDEERIGCSVQRYNLQVDHALVEGWEEKRRCSSGHAPHSVPTIHSRSRQLDRLSPIEVHSKHD
jgi:hypothetical protein